MKDTIQVEVDARVHAALGFDPSALGRPLTKSEFMSVLKLAVAEMQKVTKLIDNMFVVARPQA